MKKLLAYLVHFAVFEWSHFCLERMCPIASLQPVSALILKPIRAHFCLILEFGGHYCEMVHISIDWNVIPGNCGGAVPYLYSVSFLAVWHLTISTELKVTVRIKTSLA
jgi:hypothetical protein